MSAYTIIIVESGEGTSREKDDLGLPRVEATFRESCVRRIPIDGGAEVNVMTVELAESLGLEILMESGGILRMADQTSVFIMGVAKAVPTTVSGMTVGVDFMVVEETKKLLYPAILGRPWLYRARVTEDWGNQEFCLGQSKQKISWILEEGEEILEEESGEEEWEIPEEDSGEEEMAPLTIGGEVLEPVWFLVEEEQPEDLEK